ncbi:MAG: hypothetical protein EPO40_36695 [Myxococcaceae bacterium]|nr:MAG: hypothetical protein EPO40_36695 [Myxococcaceae bacterium]
MRDGTASSRRFLGGLAVLLAACGGPTAAPAADASTPDVPTPPAGPDDPIVGAEPRRWTWVPIEGMRCIDGSPTGIGVNVAPGAEGLVIFLMGGGACFNEETCASVFHADGFDEGAFRAETRAFSASGPVSRIDASNPFRNWSFAYVGYCTGDAHAGDNPEGVVIGGRRRVFVGHRNVRLALRRLLPTFRGVGHVLVTGVSAGGFGAAYHYDGIAQAFGPATDVSLLNDSGPPLNDDVLAPCLQRTWRTLWNLDATFPADCTECRAQADGGGISRLADFLARKYPTRRLGIVSAMGDGVPRDFFSWGHGGDCAQRGDITADELGRDLLATRQRLAGTGFRSYLVASQSHTWLLRWNSTRVGGLPLSQWAGAIGTGVGPLVDVGPGAP